MKLRWSSDIEGVAFKLYIPQERVPTPWPRRIHVSISESTADGSNANSSAWDSREEPIVCIVERVTEHTKTVRYRPLGDPKNWEIGEPYIPFALLSDDIPARLRVEVSWDRSAGTWPE